MKKFDFIATLLLIASISAPLLAQEFLYVTDSLQLRVYAQANDSSELLQTIESGESVEVLANKNGFSQVTTNDGTIGWVKSAFLVIEPPEKLLYYSVSEQNKKLEAQIEALQTNPPVGNASFSSEAEVARINELQKTISQLQNNNKTLQQQLTDNSENTRGQTKSVADTYTVVGNDLLLQWFVDKKWWLMGSVIALLVTGFITGLKLSSWRMQKRLHGFRLK
jgi:SH3 domain protein